MKYKLSLLPLAVAMGLSQGAVSAQEQGSGAEYIQKTKLYANNSGWNPGLDSGGDLDTLFNKIIPALMWTSHHKKSSFVDLEFLGVYTINDEGEVNGLHKVYELDSLEVVADQKMQSSFTNNTAQPQTWRPSTSYSRTSSTTTSTESNWGHDFSTKYSLSMTVKESIPLLPSYEVNQSFEVGYQYSKGGSNTKTDSQSETVTVGSGGSYIVNPGETLTIQDMYGKSQATLKITGRQAFFGEVGYVTGYTGPHGSSSSYRTGFGYELQKFLKKWNDNKWNLLHSHLIGYSDFVAGERLYASFPHDEYFNPSVPTQEELDFLVQNSSAWTDFQDNMVWKSQRYHPGGPFTSSTQQYMGVMDGTLTTVIEANGGVHSILYSDQIGEENKLMRTYKAANQGRSSRGLSKGDDLFSGTDGSDEIYPMTGSDIIHAGEGNDTIIAERYEGIDDNTDVFYGQGGDDTIVQHDPQSHSTIYGGKGDDVLESKGQLSALIGGQGTDSFTLHETVQKASIRDEGQGETSHITIVMTEAETMKVSRVLGGDVILTFENGSNEPRRVLLQSMYSAGEPILSIVKKGEWGEKERVLTKEEVISLADKSGELNHFSND